MNNDYMFEDEENNFTGNYEGAEYSFYQEPQPQKKESIGLAVVSLILGLLSLVFFLIGLNIIFALASIVLGIIFIASFKQKRGKGLAITGIVASVISIVLFAVSWGFILHNIDNIAAIGDDMDGMYEWYYYYGSDDDMYQDFFDEYQMFENPGDDSFPFDNRDFNMDDTL